MRRLGKENQPGFWPGVSDAFLGALMMVLLLALGGLMLYVLRPKPAKAFVDVAVLLAKIKSLEKEVIELRDRIKLLDDENRKLKANGKLLEEENIALKDRVKMLEEDLKDKDAILAKRPQDDPPIIQFTDIQTISFESGEAKLSDAFRADLEETHFNNFVNIVNKYPVVDTIEIIGHTDRKELSHTSSLDKNLNKVLQGEKLAEDVSPGSNADLGLMRSLAVRQCWDNWLKQRAPGGRAMTVNVRVYSASSAVLPGTPPASFDGSPESKRANDDFDKSARRIEIRFTKLKRDTAKP
jgi:outer membrane protein OmpA-like peptidoglycan-associated protein